MGFRPRVARRGFRLFASSSDVPTDMTACREYPLLDLGEPPTHFRTPRRGISQPTCLAGKGRVRARWSGGTVVVGAKFRGVNEVRDR